MEKKNKPFQKLYPPKMKTILSFNIKNMVSSQQMFYFIQKVGEVNTSSISNTYHPGSVAS